MRLYTKPTERANRLQKIHVFPIQLLRSESLHRIVFFEDIVCIQNQTSMLLVSRRHPFEVPLLTSPPYACDAAIHTISHRGAGHIVEIRQFK